MHKLSHQTRFPALAYDQDNGMSERDVAVNSKELRIFWQEPWRRMARDLWLKWRDPPIENPSRAGLPVIGRIYILKSGEQ